MHLPGSFQQSGQKKGPAEPIANGVEAIRRKRDLSDIAGTWTEDPAFDAAIAEQDTIWQPRKDSECVSAAERANS
jgi:hypothetical protein